MKRFAYILYIGLLFGVHAAQATTFKIATTAPDGSTWMKEIREGADLIAQQTNNRVNFKFYTGGVMGGANSVLKKMRIHQLHGGAFTSGDLSEVYPDIQIYGLPFLFRSYAEVDFVRSKMDDTLRKGMAQKGMVVLGMSDGGFAYMMSDTPVRAVDQLSGKKVWLPEGDEITATAYEIAGIAPVSLNLADVYTGLQTGMVDTIGTSPVGAIAFQWHTRVKYAADIPLIYLMGLLVMDKQAFAEITESDRHIVLDVMTAAMNKLEKINREDDAKARRALQQQGIEFLTITADERKRSETIGAKAIEKLGKRGVFTKDMYNQLLKHLQEFRSKQSAASNAPQ